VFICPDRGEHYFSLKRYFHAGRVELRGERTPVTPSVNPSPHTPRG
jgi:hypothetical protein